MYKRLRDGIGLVLVAVAVCSCGPKAGVDVERTVSDAQQMATEGKVDQAIATLEPLFKSRHYQASRPLLLNVMVQIELSADRLEAAQTRFMNVVRKSPEVAVQVVGLIENVLATKGQHQELMKWCVNLSAYKLGDDALVATANRHIAALYSLGRTGEVAQVVGIYLPTLSIPGAIGLASAYFGEAIRDQQWARAESLQSVMEKLVKDSPEKHVAKVSFTIDLLLAKDGWKAADTYFRKVMNEVPDSGAARNIRVVGAAEVAANEVAAADALYEFGLVTDKARPQLRDAASVEWVNLEAKRGVPMELIRRLTVLREKSFSGETIINFISMHYAVLINSGNRESFDALNQLCEAIRTGSDVKMSMRQLDGILLDISYFREDYEGSLKIIDRGLIPDDPTKKDMLITKVKAHMALKKGDYKVAIECFRKFMEVIAKDNADTVDPIEQVRVSPDMILGLNARRIGDLWGKAGNPEEATKAYAEARQYYTEALKKFPDVASGENKKIMREMKDIPLAGQ